ncbi:hypothetical protein BDE02_15G093900 [Populus trichocarpa]|nr:hypothetical protein BDE02_15G093900 [Populus trichocarpa]
MEVNRMVLIPLLMSQLESWCCILQVNRSSYESMLFCFNQVNYLKLVVVLGYMVSIKYDESLKQMERFAQCWKLSTCSLA